MRSFGKSEAVERASIIIFQNDSSSIASPGNFRDIPTITIASDNAVDVMSCLWFAEETVEVLDETDSGVAES
jgi:hypothetical protein